MYVYVYMYMFMCVYIYVYIYISIYLYIYIAVAPIGAREAHAPPLIFSKKLEIRIKLNMHW